jgi:hypothetical protein
MRVMKSAIKYIILFSLSISSCQKILFNNDTKTREIILEDFTAVKIFGIYNIILVQDPTNRLVITGSYDISSVDATVINDTLIIDDHKNFSFNADKNSLILHFSNLSYLETNDPVNISNKDTIKANRFKYDGIGEITEARLVIDCDQLIVSNSANTLGFFHFIGKAEYCLLWNRYGSGMFADSLLCRDADIYTESIGPVNINASDHISAFIRGPGNIYYHGNPEIEIIEKNGEGKIIKLDW